MDDLFVRLVSTLAVWVTVLFVLVVGHWTIISINVDRKGCEESVGCTVHYLRNGEFAFEGDYARSDFIGRTYKNGKRIR